MTNNKSRSQKKSPFNSTDAPQSEAFHRFSLMEKLRRLLFKPMILAPAIITIAALTCGTVTAQDPPTDPPTTPIEKTFVPDQDMIVATNEYLTTFNSDADFQSTESLANKDKTITLDGGEFQFLQKIADEGVVEGTEGDTLSLGSGDDSVKQWSWTANGGTIHVGTADSAGAPSLTFYRYARDVDDDTTITVFSTDDGGDVQVYNVLDEAGNIVTEGGKPKVVTAQYLIDNDIPEDKASACGFYRYEKEGGTWTTDGKNLLFAGGDQPLANNTLLPKLTIKADMADEQDLVKNGNGIFVLHQATDGQVRNLNSVTIENNIGTVAAPNYASAGQTYLHGETVINGKVTIHNGLFVFDEDSTVTFNNNIEVAGSTVKDSTQFGQLTLVGTVNFGNDCQTISLTGNTQLFVAPETPLNYNKAKISLAGAAIVVGQAKDLKTEIIFGSGRNDEYNLLEYSNFNRSEGITSDNKPGVQTVDEGGLPTILSRDTTVNDLTGKGRFTQQDLVDMTVKNKISSSGTDSAIRINHYQASSKDTNPASAGTTVIFDSEGNNAVVADASNPGADRFTGYQGKLGVALGTVAFKGNTVFGSKTTTSDGAFDFVVNGTYITPRNDGLYDISSSGKVAILRDSSNQTVGTANVAPVINKRWVDFRFSNGFNGNDVPDLEEKGAQLVIDTGNFGSTNNIWNSPDRTLLTVNAEKVFFQKNNEGNVSTEIWYDKISTADSGSKMEIKFTKDTKFYAYSATVDDQGKRILDVSPENTMTEAEIEGVFGQAQLVDASYDSATGTVTVNAKSAAEYAIAENMSTREREYASQLDTERRRTDADMAFNDALYNETDADKVKQTIHNLSLRNFVLLNAYGHYGSVVSSYSPVLHSAAGLGAAGSAISGSSRRGQSLEESANSTKVQTDNLSQSVFANSGEGDSQWLSRSLWASFTHTSVNGYDYMDGGMPMHGYDMRRSGLMLGIRRQLTDTFSGGLFFALSSPEATSQADIAGVAGNAGKNFARMEMEDFQYALHFEKIFLQNWEVAVFVGGGTQTMDWERNTNLGNTYNFTSSGSGKTFTATAYLARRIDMTNNWTLRPTIGIDSEHSWLKGFNEELASQTGDATVSWGNRMFTRANEYGDVAYSRNTARLGVTSSFQGPQGYGGLTGRAFYGVQLGGDDAPMISVNGSDPMQSHAMGGESFNLGAGGYWYLNPCKTLTLTADINGIWYKNATTQNVTAGLSYRF